MKKIILLSSVLANIIGGGCASLMVFYVLFIITPVIRQKWRAYFGAKNTTCTSKTWIHAHLVPRSRQPKAADSKES